MTISIDPIANTPKGVDMIILRNLNEQDLAICCMVSKTWRERASADSLWRNIFPGLELTGNDLKSYVDERAVKSIGGVLQVFQQTLNTLSPDKILIFSCAFPFNPLRLIQFSFGYGNVSQGKEPDIKEYSIFTRICQSDKEIKLSERHYQDSNYDSTIIMGYHIKLPSNEEITSLQLASLIEAVFRNTINELLQAGKIKHKPVHTHHSSYRRPVIKPVVGSSFPRMYGTRK